MSALSADLKQQIPFARTLITPEAREAAMRVMESGWLTTGPEVVAFESDMAAWIGARHIVGVSSCTAAIEIALRALQLRPGSRVLTSTITFCGAIHAIVHAGHRPVLADVDPETMMPNAETVAAAARGGVDAMVAVDYAGLAAPLDETAAAARLPVGRVVEDAAHALGTEVGNHSKVGTRCAATCFSFYATKNLPIGEGGMISTDDPDIAAIARSLRIHGMSGDAWKRYMPGGSWRYTVADDGIKANMTDVQAAIGRAHLRSFDSWQQRREQLARKYDEHLADVAGIGTPPWPASGRHAWHLYVIRVGREYGLTRDELFTRLAELGIHCSVHFIPNHTQPYFKKFLDAGSAYPNADAAFDEILSLPFSHWLTDVEVERVCEAIASLGARRARSKRVPALDVVRQ